MYQLNIFVYILEPICQWLIKLKHHKIANFTIFLHLMCQTGLNNIHVLEKISGSEIQVFLRVVGIFLAIFSGLALKNLIFHAVSFNFPIFLIFHPQHSVAWFLHGLCVSQLSSLPHPDTTPHSHGCLKVVRFPKFSILLTCYLKTVVSHTPVGDRKI